MSTEQKEIINTIVNTEMSQDTINQLVHLVRLLLSKHSKKA